MVPTSPTLDPDVLESGLKEQHATLRAQIPLMYMLMTVNVAFLSIVMFDAVPAALSLGAPILLVTLASLRAGLWLMRRDTAYTAAQMKRQLRGTMMTAPILSLLFGGWALVLFSEADPIRASAVALYVFMGAISCAYCLQALQGAALFVLLFGAAPVTVRMLFSGDLYLFGVGFTFVLIGSLVMRTLTSTREAVEQILRSRVEIAELYTALQKSEEHHRYSVELNPQIPWISDPDGNVVELSGRWSEFTGIPLDQALGDGWIAAVHPDDLPKTLAVWNETLAAREGVLGDTRYRLRHWSGSYRWFRARANSRRAADGSVICWYGNLEDVDDQVAAETALRESEERYRLAARATKDIIWDWTPATDTLQWAGDLEALLGHRVAGETPVSWWYAQIHPDDLSVVMSLNQRIVGNQQDSWSHEYRVRAADGSYRHLFMRGYAIRDGAGTVVRAIGAMSDITAAKQSEEHLRWAAYHDALTELPNRKRVAEELESALARAAASACNVGVIVVDVDGFKLINDSLGHSAGDAVLKMVAKRLCANIPDGATVGRLGGDEFAVILPDLSPADACAETVSRILAGVGQAMPIEGSVMDVSLSAGAAMWPMDGAKAEDMMKSADLALYAAKAEGTGNVRGFKPGMRGRLEERNRMLRDAREALQDDRVVPFYQPKLALRSGEVIGFESLLRWHHHRNGLQPPSGIAAAFEDSALAVQLTDRMLDQVLADMRKWLDQGIGFGRIAINGAPADFRRDDLADRILSRCHAAAIPPSLLELEVTETVLLERLADRTFRTLREAGVTIALDDFGTGYASLTHLQQFPVNVLKIDRSFVSKLDGTDVSDRAIVQGVISIARRMNIQTVGEGIENEAQAHDLRELGCDVGQGYLYSRAIPADRVPAFLDATLRAREDARPISPSRQPPAEQGSASALQRQPA